MSSPRLARSESGGSRRVVFEVKTTATTQAVYTGIGQLILGSGARGPKNRAVLVLPAPLPNGLAERLEPEGIELLGFEWQNDATVVFPGLDEVLRAVR